mmetsp:Transcript_3021/g.7542  ORF Transcript_3021/g.7542 Transcript_3021/m.7542 type:complete len:249 (-) Transcript_3021:13-759(-)
MYTLHGKNCGHRNGGPQFVKLVCSLEASACLITSSNTSVGDPGSFSLTFRTCSFSSFSSLIRTVTQFSLLSDSARTATLRLVLDVTHLLAAASKTMASATSCGAFSVSTTCCSCSMLSCSLFALAAALSSSYRSSSRLRSRGLCSPPSPLCPDLVLCFPELPIRTPLDSSEDSGEGVLDLRGGAIGDPPLDGGESMLASLGFFWLLAFFRSADILAAALPRGAENPRRNFPRVCPGPGPVRAPLCPQG